jgi:hypothetical protein
MANTRGDRLRIARSKHYKSARAAAQALLCVVALKDGRTLVQRLPSARDPAIVWAAKVKALLPR